MFANLFSELLKMRQVGNLLFQATFPAYFITRATQMLTKTVLKAIPKLAKDLHFFNIRSSII